MKFPLALYVCLIIPIFLISSCVSEKGFEKPFLKEQLSGKEPGEKVFVIRKDGERVTGKVITFSPISIWRVRQKEYWVAIDGKKQILLIVKATRNQRPFSFNTIKLYLTNLFPINLTLL